MVEHVPFKLKSEFEPQGDQPQAIQKIVDGVNEGKRHQTLLGATGTGKTFTMSNVIKEVGKPTLIIAHNKTLAGQLYSEFKEFFDSKNLLYLTCKSLISCYFSEHFPLTSQLRKHRLLLIPYQENERY